MKRYPLLAAVALALAACNNNDEVLTSTDEPLNVTATINDGGNTRASETSWAIGDAIGISSIVGDVKGPFINYQYNAQVVNDTLTGKFTGSPIFFYKPMTLTAYYPFTGSQDTAPGNEGIITANTGTEQQTAENQPKIDFLWDTKTGVDNKDFSANKRDVNFTFAHKMSKLSFTFQSSDPVYDDKDPSIKLSDGVDVGTMVSYEIEGLVLDGAFDTATGVCAIDETKDPQNLKISFDKEAKEMKERSFPSLIVFPQTNGKGYILHIETDELASGSPTQFYKCALTFNGYEIKPGYHYQFTIKVTRRGLIVGKLSIEPWTKSEKFISASIDGSVTENKEI